MALGAEIFQGDLLLPDVSVGLLAGVLYSSFDMSGNFEPFDRGLGLRAGVRFQTMLAKSLDLEGTLDYRQAKFDYTGTVFSGDEEAVVSGPAATLGIAYRF